jgi:fructokinase
MRIGIDLGGSKIEIAALETDGTLSIRERVAAPAGDYPATLRTLRELVSSVETRRGARGSVGVGIPGTVSPDTGLVKNANSTWLIGKPFDRDLAAALGREVRVANDANCFALSEAVDGAGAGKRVVFGVIVGTGVGGGIVVDGRVLTGPHAIAGEWGHNDLPWPLPEEFPGPACYCGKLGCIETFLSGPGLARDHYGYGGDNVKAPEIVHRAESGDKTAIAAIGRYCDRFARSLATVINVLDPDIVVLGGGLSNIAALYRDVPHLLPNYVFSDVCRTPIVKNLHGDSSGVRGAAWLWPPD